MKIWPGNPYPLGATYDGSGTNFSIFTENGERVELCLFDEQGNETKVDLPEVTGYCRHGYLPKIKPGQRYGYRIHGPWDPSKGYLFNPAKLLLDPYAKAIDGQIRWDEALYSYQKDDNNSAPFMPKGVIHDPYFDWSGDKKLNIPWHETVLYEVNVRGFTIQHPDLPQEIRGTYSGLAHPQIIDYLKKLGITAVELMPVHYFITNRILFDHGLKNYWGYDTLGFFAPHPEYGSLAEFKEMVRALHQAGIEVILDVVYNHTAEGNHLGPFLSFKGIDNLYYYRLSQADLRYYVDYTGTGNSLNMRNPHTLQLIMDSLRYWILEMHVDGFRFDLAATLARELHDVDRLSAFFDIIQQDPVISQVKLIAEPWDVGEGGYQVGNFPPGWSEWNGKYRDCVKDFWRGEPQIIGEFASRFTGSSDLYQSNSRLPSASINYITSHDGFTLQDLVSYNEKHNEADPLGGGEDNNKSWNCGAEGPTDDPAIIALRTKQKRNFLTTLFLSQGAPMLLSGDEIGRTQKGNNNAYCQDNELSWIDWKNKDEEFLHFCQKLIQFRHKHPVFHRRHFFEGRPLHGSPLQDIEWFTKEGQTMTTEDWGKGFKSLGVFLNGKTIPNSNARGEPVTDNSFYLIFNAEKESLEFTLPDRKWGEKWTQELDTAKGWVTDEFSAEAKIKVEANSLIVLSL